MKKRTSLLTLVLITLTLAACVQMPIKDSSRANQLAVSSVRDLPVSYPQGSLFLLSPKYVKETSLKTEQTQAIYHLYSKAIVNDLTNNGYVNGQVKQQTAFYIGFGIALSDNFSDEKINDKFGVTLGLPESSDLRKGSLLIYIEDAETGQRVWRGVAQGFANTRLTLAQRKKRTAVVVENVMKQFYQTN